MLMLRRVAPALILLLVACAGSLPAQVADTGPVERVPGEQVNDLAPFHGEHHHRHHEPLYGSPEWWKERIKATLFEYAPMNDDPKRVTINSAFWNESAAREWIHNSANLEPLWKRGFTSVEVVYERGIDPMGSARGVVFVKGTTWTEDTYYPEPKPVTGLAPTGTDEAGVRELDPSAETIQ